MKDFKLVVLDPKADGQSEIKWYNISTEWVNVAEFSNESRIEVKDKPDQQIAGSLRKVF